MSNVIVTGSFQHDLQPGVTKYFGDLNVFPELYSKVFDVRDSNMSFEQVTQNGELGLASKMSDGTEVLFDSGQEGWTKASSHIKYGTGVQISRDAIDDGKSGQAMRFAGERLRTAMEKSIEVIAHAKINNYTSTASAYVGGDGVAYGSTAHPSLAGNISNIVTGNPPLSEAALEQACIQIKGLPTHRGLKANVMPKMLLVPDALEFEAERILKSDLRVGTADNDLNALKSLGKLPGGYMVDTYLTSTTQWQILTDAPEGLILFFRRRPDVQSDNHFTTETARYISIMRLQTTHNDFRSMMFSPGA